MVQAAEPLVRAVLFLGELADSWHSSVGLSALDFLVESRMLRVFSSSQLVHILRKDDGRLRKGILCQYRAHWCQVI